MSLLNIHGPLGSQTDAQCRALENFRRWALDPLLAVLDTETTGLGSAAQVIEVTAINWKEEVLFSSRVKPTTPIEPGAQAIHGITLEDLQDAPSWPEVFEQLQKALSDFWVVTYGASFDIRVMSQSCSAHNTELSWGAECVMVEYAKFWGEPGPKGPKWQSLVNACKQQVMDTSDLPDAHTSLGDCIRTLRLIQAVAAQWEG